MTPRAFNLEIQPWQLGVWALAVVVYLYWIETRSQADQARALRDVAHQLEIRNWHLEQVRDQDEDDRFDTDEDSRVRWM